MELVLTILTLGCYKTRASTAKDGLHGFIGNGVLSKLPLPEIEDSENAEAFEKALAALQEKFALKTGKAFDSACPKFGASRLLTIARDRHAALEGLQKALKGEFDPTTGLTDEQKAAVLPAAEKLVAAVSIDDTTDDDEAKISEALAPILEQFFVEYIELAVAHKGKIMCDGQDLVKLFAPETEDGDEEDVGAPEVKRGMEAVLDFIQLRAIQGSGSQAASIVEKLNLKLKQLGDFGFTTLNLQEVQDPETLGQELGRVREKLAEQNLDPVQAALLAQYAAHIEQRLAPLSPADRIANLRDHLIPEAVALNNELHARLDAAGRQALGLGAQAPLPQSEQVASGASVHWYSRRHSAWQHADFAGNGLTVHGTQIQPLRTQASRVAEQLKGLRAELEELTRQEAA